MKILERKKATDLRKQGLTFTEILKEIPVSKASLSYWLKDIKLTDEQLARISYKNDKIKRNFIGFNELRKIYSEDSKRNIVSNAIQEIDAISTRELKLIGIALYWAEGYKAGACSGAEFTNTDPAMIKLMMRWFREICGVQENRFRIRIQIHDAGNIEKARRYWLEITGIDYGQFTKAYVKTSPTSKRKVGDLAPYGICSIRISDINLITKIKGWIEGLGAIV
ncbi:MAG: hypothetical protein ABIG31_00360 [Candidatus Omnitrophota bacterium]